MGKPTMRVFLFFCLSLSATAAAEDYVPGEVIVKYRDGILRTRAEMNDLYDGIGVKKVRYFLDSTPGYEQLILKDSVRVEEAVSELHKRPVVEYAQPNYILRISVVRGNDRVASEGRERLGSPCWVAGASFPPGCVEEFEQVDIVPARPELKPAPDEVIPPLPDPDVSKLWGMESTQAKDAWNSFRGSRHFIVADLDSGIDYNHEDLAFNIWRNPNPSDKMDVVGFDFVHNDGLPYDDHGHGTHTAGTLGAVGGNGIGISGVNQQVSIMALKFLGSGGGGSSADAVRGIDYAVAHGAKVINGSFSSLRPNPALRDALGRAKEKDILFVASAGNRRQDIDTVSEPPYPAVYNLDNMLIVVASDTKDVLAAFSSYGKKATHLAAPGVDVYSTLPNNKYDSMSGVSMAVPHVAGAAALIWSRHPKWDLEKVKSVLLETVDPVPDLVEKTSSGGRLNVWAALQSD